LDLLKEPVFNLEAYIDNCVITMESAFVTAARVSTAQIAQAPYMQRSQISKWSSSYSKSDVYDENAVSYVAICTTKVNGRLPQTHLSVKEKNKQVPNGAI